MKNKKLLYLFIGILILVITITGGTYAYFALQVSNNNITGTTANVGLVLTVDKISPLTQGVDDLIPQLESALGTAINDSHKCIDGNNNAVCQVYKATITNNGTSNVKLKGTITFTGISNIPHLKWKMITDATTIGSGTGVVATTTATDFVQEVTLAPNGHEDYYFVIWIDEINQTQNESGTFGATLTFNSSDGQGLTSTIGVEPTTTTVYEVTDSQRYIGRAIPSGANVRTTAAEAMADWTTYVYGGTPPFYLKHVLNGNNEIEESYVEFVVTPEMASANLGMTAGTYALRGAGATSNGNGEYNDDSPYYVANVETLKRAFGENSSYCSDFTSSSRVSCDVSELNVYANANGDVIAQAGSTDCQTFADGYSSCYWDFW